ncbi:DUF6282 family protein [Chloroflexota bacterium]
MNVIDRLMSGSIDMHVHFTPDSLAVRRQDALRLAQSARDAGMRAVVLKSREFNTVPVAMLASELVPEVSVIGSITLDNEVGGLNPVAVMAAARMGARVVWMPTLTAANSKAKWESVNRQKLSGAGQSVFDASGKLRPEVKEIVQIVKEYDICLSSGHLSPRETFALVEEAQKAGVARMVITHALQGGLIEEALTPDDVKQLAQSGAYIEHSLWGVMPTIGTTDLKKVVDSIKDTGAERCIMTSDFGQDLHPPAPEGLRLFIATMLRNGIDEKEIELMVKTNPARLVGLG